MSFSNVLFTRYKHFKTRTLRSYRMADCCDTPAVPRSTTQPYFSLISCTADCRDNFILVLVSITGRRTSNIIKFGFCSACSAILWNRMGVMWRQTDFVRYVECIPPTPSWKLAQMLTKPAGYRARWAGLMLGPAGAYAARHPLRKQSKGI